MLARGVERRLSFQYTWAVIFFEMRACRLLPAADKP
jgi:hypothetical protein